MKGKIKLGDIEYLREILGNEFEDSWYSQTYLHDLTAHSLPDETPFEFYMRQGALRGHDPHPYFSEIFYRLNNAPALGGEFFENGSFGFSDYVVARRNGVSQKVADYETCRALRHLYLGIDTSYISDNHSEDFKHPLAAFDFYLERCFGGKAIDPRCDFSEPYYLMRYPDVASAVEAGQIISGYQHFISSGAKERRSVASVAEYSKRDETAPSEVSERALESIIPGITLPVDLGVADAITKLVRRMTIQVSLDEVPAIVCFLPQFFPEIFFGGFSSFFEFLTRMRAESGLRVIAYIVNDVDAGVFNAGVQRVAARRPDVAAIFEAIHHFRSTANILEVPIGSLVVSYCAETHFVASQVAAALKKDPVFFIQDDESLFHPLNSLSSMCLSAFELPHVGVINSHFLAEYLIETGNYPSLAAPNYRYVTFENKLMPLTLSAAQFESLHHVKSKHRMVLYGRPEGHAARNLYALSIVALREAIANGVFDDTWEFYAIGSLSFEGIVDLGNGRGLNQLTRVSKTDYETFIASADIGISLISTPHPGIIHFQMACFGLITVTNAAYKRRAADLMAVCGNIIPCSLTFNGLISSIREAVMRVPDLKARHKAATEARVAYDDSSMDRAVSGLLRIFELQKSKE